MEMYNLILRIVKYIEPIPDTRKRALGTFYDYYSKGDKFLTDIQLKHKDLLFNWLYTIDYDSREFTINRFKRVVSKLDNYKEVKR